MVGKSNIGAELHLFHSTARDDIFYTSVDMANGASTTAPTELFF